MFITPAFAASTAGQPSILAQFLPLIIIFVIFYFLLIRPQQKRQKEHRAKLNAVVKGDTVITSGGIKAKVTKVDEENVSVEIAPKVEVVVIKSTLLDVEKK
ncbi:MAG: preprotein translocase subunit YajC [Alphaproteobacteria bacterium]